MSYRYRIKSGMTNPASINAAAYMDSGSEAGMTATFFPSVPLCLCGEKTAQPA